MSSECPPVYRHICIYKYTCFRHDGTIFLEVTIMQFMSPQMRIMLYYSLLIYVSTMKTLTSNYSITFNNVSV